MGHLIRDVCSSANVLPTTGTDPVRFVLTSIGLVVAGLALLVWSRRARRAMSAVAMVISLFTLLHTAPPRAEAACDPAVSATVAVATTSTSTTSTTTTTLAESSPPIVSTTVPTVLADSTSSSSSSSSSSTSSTSTSSTSTSTTTTVAPPNVVPDVPVPALASASFLVVMLGARGLVTRDRPSRPPV